VAKIKNEVVSILKNWQDTREALRAGKIKIKFYV